MASYIDNVFENARIQDIQAFTPDWSFLTQAQQQLSATQRKNFSDFAQKYNSIIDSNLTREDNITLRDNYKRQADDFIKQVSGMDLTDPRNLKAAEAVFTPLVDNKMYIRDIINTKAVEQASARASAYANSLNPAERDLYNENSLKELGYFVQDFKNATPDQAINMQAPSYVNGVNLEKMALNFFNRKNYDVEVDTPNGQWIVKTKNGQLIENNVFNGLLSEFYSDPLVRKNVSLENEMSKRDYVEQNVNRFGGNRLAAENAYYQERYSTVLSQYEKNGKVVEETVDVELDAIKYGLDALSKGENTDNPAVNEQPSLYSNNLAETAAELERLKTGIKQEKDLVLQESTVKSKATAPYSVTIDGKQYTPQQLDSILFQNRVAGIARNLSQSRSSQTIRNNDFALEQYKFQLDLKARQYQNELDKDKALFEKRLEGINVATGLPFGPEEQTDYQAGVTSILEDEKDKKKLVQFSENQLTAKAGEIKTSEDKLIKNMMQLYPDMTGKALNELTEKDRMMILKRAETLVKTNAVSKAKYNVLAPALESYKINSEVYKTLNDKVVENLRVSIQSSAVPAEDKKLLLEILKETSQFDKIKEKFVEKKSKVIQDQIVAKAYGPFGRNPLLEIPSLFTTTNPVKKAGEIFDDYFSDDAKSISDEYFKRAKTLSPSQMGFNVGVGGYTNFGKDLGPATNTGRGIADIVVEYTNKAVKSNNIKDAVIGDGRSKTPESLGSASQAVLQTFLDQISQPQKENVSALETLNVKVRIDPSTGEQFITVQPNEALTELIYNSGESKASLVTPGQAQRIVKEGMTFKLPKGAIPQQILGFEKVSPYAELFALKGSIKLGGNTAADGGFINITRNAQGTLDVVAARYENGKSIPIPALENKLNESYAFFKANPNLDADLELMKLTESYIKGFKQAR